MPVPARAWRNRQPTPPERRKWPCFVLLTHPYPTHIRTHAHTRAHAHTHTHTHTAAHPAPHPCHPPLNNHAGAPAN